MVGANDCSTTANENTIKPIPCGSATQPIDAKPLLRIMRYDAHTKQISGNCHSGAKCSGCNWMSGS